MMIDMLPFKFFFAARLETTSESNSLLSLAVLLLFVLLAAKHNFIPFHLISPTCAVTFLLLHAKRFIGRCSWWQISKFPTSILPYFQCASVLCNPSNINLPKLFPKHHYISLDRESEREGRRGRGRMSSLAGGQTGWGCGFFVLHPHKWQMFHTHLYWPRINRSPTWLLAILMHFICVIIFKNHLDHPLAPLFFSCVY